MLTTTYISDDPIGIKYISGNDARNFGALWNKDAKLFMRSALKPAGMIDKTGYVTVLATVPDLFKTWIQNEALTQDPEIRYYNSYKEKLTPDLSQVTPVAIGKMKNLITQFTSIQRGNLNEDSHIVIQIGEIVKCVTKFDLTNIYLGALNKHTITTFVTVFKGFNPQSIQYLLEVGYRSELKPIVETIGTLDLSFNQEQYLWMKSLTQD